MCVISDFDVVHATVTELCMLLVAQALQMVVLTHHNPTKQLLKY